MCRACLECNKISLIQKNNIIKGYWYTKGLLLFSKQWLKISESYIYNYIWRSFKREVMNSVMAVLIFLTLINI